MAGEITFVHTTGRVCYFQVWNSIGQVYDTVTGFEVYDTASISTYAITATEQGTSSGIYKGNMPSVAAGVYGIVARERVGGAPAESDPEVATGDIEWTGSVLGFPSNVKKNHALAEFQFLMTDSTNHSPATGKTVTCTRSIDGAAFAAGTLANVTEVANGTYTVDFGTGDLNGNVIVLRATASGCDDTFERIVTQP